MQKCRWERVPKPRDGEVEQRRVNEAAELSSLRLWAGGAQKQ